MTSSCPAQLGQLYRASFGLTLLILLLYVPFIDNQLLDNEQVLVHLKDYLVGGGMVERKVHGILELGQAEFEYWPAFSVPVLLWPSCFRLCMP